MDSWMDRLGFEGLVLIGLGVCGVVVAWQTDSKAVLKEPVPKKSWMLIDFDEMVRMIRTNTIQLFDVRDREEVKSTGLIPTSTNIPLDEVEEAFQMSRAEFKGRYGIEKPFKEDLDIVLSCYKGSRSHKAMEMLHRMGYKYARTYPGSYLEYSTIKSKVHILPTRGKRTAFCSNKEGVIYDQEYQRTQGDKRCNQPCDQESETESETDESGETEYDTVDEPNEYLDEKECENSISEESTSSSASC